MTVCDGDWGVKIMCDHIFFDFFVICRPIKAKMSLYVVIFIFQLSVVAHVFNRCYFTNPRALWNFAY